MTQPPRFIAVRTCTRQDGASRFGIVWRDPQTGRRRFAFYATADDRDAARHVQERQLNAWLHQPAPNVAPANPAADWTPAVSSYVAAISGRRPATRAEIVRVLADFSALVNPASVADVSPQTVEQYLQLRRSGLPKLTAPAEGKKAYARRAPSAETLRKEWRTLRAAFNHWKAAKLITSNPVRDVRPPRGDRRRRPKPTTAELRRLFRTIASPAFDLPDRDAWHVLVLLAASTGVRRTELLNTYVGLPYADATMRDLAAQHPDASYSLLILEPSPLLHTYQSKEHAEELAGIPPAIAAQVRAFWRRGGQRPGRLFPWSDWPKSRWLTIADHANWPHKFHALRALSLTQVAIRAGRSAARRHVGHSSEQVTRRHYLDEPAVAQAAAAAVPLPLTPLPKLPPAQSTPRARIARARPGTPPAGS